MDEPIKVIFKYKNSNKRKQYHIYIYLGTIPSKLKTILNKIKDTNLYDSLIQVLTKEDHISLEKFYGDFWYKKFFNTYHINHTISLIKKDVILQKKLTNKFSKTWYQVHIEEPEK